MEVHLVSESVKFMILGMGIVFVFLYILVLLMRLQAWVIEHFFPERAPRSDNTPTSSQGEEERARVAAIVAAVAEYRKAKGAKV
jgi:oxaloacetate decarboxylase gamma subunit